MPDNQSDEKRGPLAWMAGNSVAANLLMVFLLVGGFMYLLSIKKEVFPDFDLDRVAITVAYPGASPAEVEQGILLAVEEAVRGVDGVKEITAEAREGGGSVVAELITGVNQQKVYQDIQQEVDRITSLPDEAERPEVVLVARSRGVVDMVVYGDQNESVLREVAEQARDRLLESPLITKVELDGIRPYEISIEISQDTLRTYRLTLTQVAGIIRRSALELPGGGIKTEGGEILLRIKERRDWGSEFAEIPIIENTGGTPVLLGDIAEIIDGFEDTDASATWNGLPAVGIDVYRVGEQTPTEVALETKRIISEIKKDLPPGISIAVRRDRSEIYQQRMNLLLRNAYIGLSLVLVLLGLFLESRIAFWVTMGIPISFLGAFLILPSTGVTINMISMFAFIVALGIVVDDAIVVGENIFEHMQKGDPFLPAAVRGVREVAMPVTFSVLTNVVTFLPLMFIPGIMGKIFKNIPIVVCLVFLISLLECLFILPAHLAHSRRERSRLNSIIFGWQRAFSQWFRNMVRRVYGPFLRFVLNNRYVALAAGVMVLSVVLGFVFSGRMGFDLMPRVESDHADVTAVLPYGVPVEKVEAVRSRIIKAAQEVVEAHGGEQLCRGIYGSIGSRANSTRVSVYLTPPEIRPVSTRDFTRLWRKQVGTIIGTRSILFIRPGRAWRRSIHNC